MNIDTILKDLGIGVGSKFKIESYTNSYEIDINQTILENDFVKFNGDKVQKATVSSLKSKLGPQTVVSENISSSKLFQMASDKYIFIGYDASQQIACFIITTDSDGYVISSGTKIVLHSIPYDSFDAIQLNQNKLLISCRGTSDIGEVFVVDTTTENLVKGTVYTFEPEGMSYSSLAKISEGKVAIFYRLKTDSQGYVRTLDINDTVITANPRQNFQTATMGSFISSFILTSGKILLIYATSGSVKVELFSEVNNSFTKTGSVSPYTQTGRSFDAVELTPNRVIITWSQSYSTNKDAYVQIIDIDSNFSLTLGSSYLFATNWSLTPRFLSHKENEVLLFYGDQQYSNRGTLTPFRLHNNSIYAETDIVFDTNATSNISIFSMADGKILMGRQDGTSFVAETFLTKRDTEGIALEEGVSTEVIKIQEW